ncbi:MAG: hypothetical protein KF817_15680 [Phycisphaeraceae bacterium]|nr:hypothetical protein [Phycisphaeraceae bacterium]
MSSGVVDGMRAGGVESVAARSTRGAISAAAVVPGDGGVRGLRTGGARTPGLLAVAAAGVMMGLAAATPAAAGPVALATWSFEMSVPAHAGPHEADEGFYAGSSLLTMWSADAAAVYTNPTGNGSAESFAKNRWSAGDFVQFSVPTSGFSGLSVSFDQTRTSTAPASFALQWSVDGSTFTDLLASYTVDVVGWSASTRNAQSVFGPTAVPSLADDRPLVHFRLVALEDATGATGLVRFDNITVTANTVPAPGALALLLGSMMVTGAPRRRRAPGALRVEHAGRHRRG